MPTTKSLARDNFFHDSFFVFFRLCPLPLQGIPRGFELEEVELCEDTSSQEGLQVEGLTCSLRCLGMFGV